MAQLNDANDLWRNEMFLRYGEINQVLLRSRLKVISSNQKLYPEYDHMVAVRDSVWYSGIMLQQFTKNTAFRVEKSGCIALRENTICFKAWTFAILYMESRSKVWCPVLCSCWLDTYIFLLGLGQWVLKQVERSCWWGILQSLSVIYVVHTKKALTGNY